MSKLRAIGFLAFVCIGFACNVDTNEESIQKKFAARKYVSYLFDPVSKTCAIAYGLGYHDAIAWQVPCSSDVIDQLSPSVREAARAAVKALPPECPR